MSAAQVALVRVGAEYPPEIAVRGGGIFEGKWYVGGPRYGSQHGWYEDRIEIIRPLVVIDPDDMQAIERLQDLYVAAESRGLSGLSMQAALREFADPKPPKPDEPQGLGAVVIDRDGSELVRVDREHQRPWRATGGRRFSWDEIDVLAINAPGAEPVADWEIDLLRGAR